jgi:hypothetical protein
MKKNDKIVVVVGVVILILAGVGIYVWAPMKTAQGSADIDEFYKILGTFSNAPNGIVVSDMCPFYPLIVTPLAVHYDSEGNQEVAPLFIENSTNPSSAITRAISMIGEIPDEFIEDNISPKDASIHLAKKHWKKSEGALLIEYSQMGYELGIIATPMASYLSIPVFVTDKMDADIEDALNKLGVTHTFVCGEDLEGYGKVMRFSNVEEVIDASIDLVLEKFGKIDYITLANPIDAWPPKVLDSFTETMGPVTIPSSASTRMFQASRNKGRTPMGTFEIPDDYKYALIKFEGLNLDYENVDDYGDWVGFVCGANLPDIPGPLKDIEVFGQSTATGGIAVRGADGSIEKDRVHVEAVLYDRGGVEYKVASKGMWVLKESGEAVATVTVEKLEHPVYSLMKKLSSMAPYLTAYHKGIVFAKKDFAFTADDDVISAETGKPSPGFYMPRRNPRIVENSNAHIYDNIVTPLNEILARLANIELRDDTDLRDLRKYYDNNPVYIALVGGATGLPNYIFQNYVEPVDYWNGQYSWGVGTPSDVMYGNIDPDPYKWDNLAGDIFTEFPYQENIVGRITGWDAQDASALIARNIFYEDIIENLDEWKDSYAILVGAGMDFREPLIRYPLAKIFGAAHGTEPMKMWTGFGEISMESLIETVAKPLGFETIYSAFEEEASRQGYSDEHLMQMKKNGGLINKLNPFYVSMLKRLVGDGAVIGGDIIEKSNFIMLNGHGNKNIMGTDGINLVVTGFAGPITTYFLKKILEVVSPYTGPGSSLSAHLQYNTREVVQIDFKPSFLWLESCICGKIDGISPQTSLGQAFLHAGLGALVASPTGSNIPGGYLEPKNRLWDTPGSVFRAYLSTKLKARQGIYPDKHFGILVYDDMCHYLKDDDATIGLAFRNAKNDYLPQDADWEIWWSPPLVTTGDFFEDMEIRNTYYERMKENAVADPLMMKNKYTTYQEYLLFGDPAFNPYVPGE